MKRYRHALAQMLTALVVLAATGCGPLVRLVRGTETPTPALASYVAQVDSLQVKVTEGEPPRVEAVVRGMFSESCAWVGRTQVERSEKTFTVTVYAETYADRGCAPAREPYEARVPLEVRGLPAGEYTVTAGDASGVFTLEQAVPAATP